MADTSENKYIAVDYKLYTNDNGTLELAEETSAERPFEFVSGFGLTLEAFEKEIISKAKDETFDFTLNSEQAYGERDEGRVLDLDKEVFSINGHFDHENIVVDALVPMQNEDGNQFTARILEVNDTTVKVDLNHPLAGKTLTFNGTIIENRDASTEEIQGFINSMNGEGGCSSCEGCGGGCGHDHEHSMDGEHSCGHCH